MVCSEKLEEVVANCWVLFVKNRVCGSVDEDIGRNHASQREDFASDRKGIAHSERVGMARYGDYVLGAEDFGLFENFAANFGESQAVGSGIEVFEASSVLNRLEGDATDTGLS